MAEGPESSSSSTPLPPPSAPEAAEQGTSVLLLPLGQLEGGRTVFERYRLDREIGRGAMGVVWAAHDTQLDLAVALKFLPEAVVLDPEAMRELARETRTGLQLTHEGIVRIYTLQQTPTLAAIAMELIDGESLAVRKARAPGGCLSVDELAPLVVQLCAALEHAHTVARVAHRDLKPGNLLVTRDGRLKITDFGIARSLSDTRTRLTSRTGLTSGTLLYMSPQQLRGKNPSAADDLYALGSTLYELLTGKPPFYRGDVFSQVMHQPPERLTVHRAEAGASGPPIPAHWEETILACLEKEPERRPASAAEVARRLASAPAAKAHDVVAASPPLLPSASGSAAAPEHGPVPDLSADVTRRVLPEALRAAGTTAMAVPPLDAPAAPGEPRLRGAPPRLASAAGVGSLASGASDGPGAPPALGAKPSLTAGRWKRRTAFALVVLALVALGGWAWRTWANPGALIVAIAPAEAPARVWVGTGAELAATDGRVAVRELAEGEHDVVVQAEGYAPWQSRVTWPRRATLEVQLSPIHGVVTLVGRPGSLASAVDARGRATALGSLPAGGELTVADQLLIGAYTFRFTHPDCTPAEQAGVTLEAGRPVRVAPEQVPLPGELRVVTTPSGAEVSVAGRVAGSTPASLKDLPSERPLVVEVRLRGHRSVRQEVTLRPREARVWQVDPLVAESGMVELRGLPEALAWADVRVTVDGRVVEPVPAATPPGAAGLDEVEVGRRVVEIVHPDYEPWRGTADVRDGAATALPVELRARPGTAVLATTPTGARVLLEGGGSAGRPALAGDAATPMRRELPPGRYRVRFELAGYEPVAREFTIAANRATEISVVLERARGAQPGQPWTVADLGLALQPIAPGSFLMGSERGDPDERPVRRVTLTRPFWLGRTEVTQAQWRAVMGEASPSAFAGADRPVEQVSWTEAVAFCRILTERERAAGRLAPGLAYTLPTEAQWEYAARAGDEAEFAGEAEAMTWHAASSAGQTQPVAQRAPNAWGLYDLHGNVAEWCRDVLGSYAAAAGTDPTGPATGGLRVQRGGAWNDPLTKCRAAERGGGRPEARASFLGFRVALVSEP